MLKNENEQMIEEVTTKVIVGVVVSAICSFFAAVMGVKKMQARMEERLDKQNLLMNLRLDHIESKIIGINVEVKELRDTIFKPRFEK